MLSAEDNLELKVEMAGKVIKLMELTFSKEPKEAVVKMVKSVNSREPVISEIESAEKETSWVAFLIIKDPSIFWTLAIAAEPSSPVMVRLPVIVLQLAKASRSV